MSIQIVKNGARTQTQVALPPKSVNIRILTYFNYATSGDQGKGIVEKTMPKKKSGDDKREKG